MTAAGDAPRLYHELAEWFHLLTAPAEYAEEAEFYTKQLMAACDGLPRTVVELGSGGGNNASHMKAHFAMTLTDVSPQMLSLSRSINPELEHIEGDMRALRLGREFDAVFVHDAVVYMTTEEDLRAAIETAFVHCRPGGAALFAPDHVRELFDPPYTDHGGHDGQDGRGLRYLEWTWDADPSDDIYTVDFAYLLREAQGSVRVEQDRHTEGVFSRDTWLRLLAGSGFQAKAVPFEHSEEEPGSLEVFVGRKP
jgi:SAM-dependent methyltransferase